MSYIGTLRYASAQFAKHSIISNIWQAEEWLYFHEGEGRATVFIGASNSRTFDFSAGDTAVFPDNSGKRN